MEDENKEIEEVEQASQYDADELKALLQGLADQQKQFQEQLDRLEPKHEEITGEKAADEYFASIVKGV